MNDLIEQFAIDCAGQKVWDFPKDPESFTFNRAELENANELKQATESLLKMSSTAFSVGEIDLMDLLKIQSKAQQAILNAKERAVMLERDIAMYNQAVGVMP